MGGTIRLQTIDTCDVDTNFSGDPTIGENDEVNREGISCVGFDVDVEVHDIDYDMGAPTDFSTRVVHYWFLYLGSPGGGLAPQASGGIRFGLEDTGNNIGWYYVGGRDTYSGGWTRIVVDCEQPFTAGSANRADIDTMKFGGQGYIKSKLPENFMYDLIQYHEKSSYNSIVEISGGTVGNPLTFEDLYIHSSIDNAYGYVEKAGGVYYVKGPLQFGDTTDNGNTYFEDKGSVVMFSPGILEAGYYNFLLKGSSGSITSFQLGDQTGGRGIQGCYLQSLDEESKFRFEATDSTIDRLQLYGTTFNDAGVMKFPDHLAASDSEIISCAFIESDEVVANTTKIQFSQFIGASSALFIPDSNHRFSDSDIINCATGLRFNKSGSYDISNVNFTGNIVDLRNDIGGTIAVNSLAGSNPATSSGAFVINNAVNLVVTCQTLGGIPISNARVAIYSTGVISATGASEYDTFMNEQTIPAGTATESFNYTVPRDITIRIRKSYPAASGYDGIDYYPYVTSGQIGANGYTLTAVLTPDITST